jgi:nucleotide-binding universal stress UspA family protein
MAIRMILAPIRGDGRGGNVLALAAVLARRFGAHIDVVHVHARPEDLLPYGVPVPGLLRETVLTSMAGTERQEEAHLRGLFRNFCQGHGLHEVDADAAVPVRGGGSVLWREQAGKLAEVVGRLGPLADLLVVARPEASGSLGRNTLEAALFDARRLTALAPPREVTEAGRCVAVAWNGSAEAARAVGLSLPVLALAESVLLFSSGAPKRSGLGVEALERYLGAHGIRGERREFGGRRRDVGKPLLEAAAAAGADMLVMGAYGQAHRRELLLGGVTEYVVGHAELPVLLGH